MPSLDDLLRWLHPVDFAVLGHGWAKHGRDYLVLVQDMLGSDPGTHELTFTHCVRLDYETRVRDDVWPNSWSDEFLEYQGWLDAGEPDGYVWGTNWSNAYPGITTADRSKLAEDWTRRLGKDMSEIGLETDRFALRLVFHAFFWRRSTKTRGPFHRCTFPSETCGTSVGQTPRDGRERTRTTAQYPLWPAGLPLHFGPLPGVR